ncbi:MAG: hypothetical protein E7620_02845 [Ruminococcaceae bacterium]|nr:hypothetical protein [Oscillospiraceae bacterium]
MYCIKCGIELSEGQEICPVCQTKVYHPDFPISGKPTYPQKEFASEEFNPRGVLFVITIFMGLILALPMLFELLWHNEVAWSGYVAGGVILFYLSFILPFWFKDPNPVIFVPSLFGAILLFLLYIDLQTEPAAWFLPFAFPITGALGGIVTAMIALIRYVRRGLLYIYGGGLIALGGWTILLEFLLRRTFNASYPVYWSPLSCLFLAAMGMMLIVIAIVKPLRDSLRKIFYIG